MKKILLLLVMIAELLIFGTANATPLFSDNFDGGASTAWGNERGNWRGNDGVYDATNPTNIPITYSSITTLPGLTDFTVDVDINDLDDGGIWLRSNYNNGNINGVLLVTGGMSGANQGLYWHIVNNGSFSSVLNNGLIGGIQNSDGHIRVEVIGDTYSAYWNNNIVPSTSLTTSAFSSGSVALYDFSPINRASSPRGQTFDNVQVADFTAAPVPEPSTILLLSMGVITLVGLKSRKGN